MYSEEDIKNLPEHIPVSENEVTTEIISAAKEKGIIVRIVPEEHDHLAVKDGLMEYIKDGKKRGIL